MKILIFFIVGLLACTIGYTQSTLPLRADTVTIEKVGGNATLKIKNATRDSVGGVLTNTGGGVTVFKKSRAINDSQVVVGSDTLTIHGASQNLQQVTDNGPRTTNILLTKKQLYTPKIASDSLAEPNFEFIVMPDLQGMTAYFPFKLYSMFDWVVANEATENIQGVITVGDLGQDATTTEFNRLDTAFDKLDAADIRYMAAAGNHDYNGGNISGGIRPSTSQWSTVFNAARYTGKPWYGHQFGGSTMNHYIKFDVGSYKFMVLTMEFLPPDSVVEWAGRVIDSFPDYKVIVSTHAYQTAWGELATDTSAHSNDTYGLAADNNGNDMWDKLIKKKENIVMVLNGHFVNGTRENNHWVRRFTNVGDSGNVVHQIFINYQKDSIGGGILDNGQGWLMKMRFHPATGDVFTSIYSPYLNQYETRVDSFNIGIPSLAIKTDVGVKGSLQVNKEIRANGGLHIGGSPKNSIPVIRDQQELVGDTSLTYLQTRLMGIRTANPVSVLDVRGSFGATNNGTNPVGYPLTYYNGVGASFKLVHPGGDWGLAINRCQNSTGGPNLTFYTSNDANPHVLAPLSASREVGRFSYQGIAADGTIKQIADFLCKVETVGANTLGGQFLWMTGGSTVEHHTDPTIRKMLLTHEGNLQISSNPTNTGFKLWVRGNVGIHKDSTEIIPSITTEYVLVQDTVTHELKRIRADSLPGGGGGSSYTFTSGLTESAGTVTNNLITGITGGQTILGSTSTNSGLNIRATSGVGAAGSDIKFQVGNNGATEAMRILHTGDVGIGHTSPGYKLHVNGSTGVDGALIFNNSYPGASGFPQLASFGGEFIMNGDGLRLNNLANNQNLFSIQGNTAATANVGVGSITSPTARLHLPAGTATANTAPLKFSSGTNLTTPENGAIEYDGTHYYGTIGSTRYQLDQQAGSTTLDQAIANGNALTTNRTIANSTFQLDITGSRNFVDGYTFGVTNTTGTVGIAIKGIAADGRGIWGEVTTGVGVYGNATSGYGVFSSAITGNALYAQSTDGLAIEALINPSSTNTDIPITTKTRATSGTAANGIGQHDQYIISTSDGSAQEAGRFGILWSNATTASRTSRAYIKLVNNAGATTSVATFDGNGQITEHGYGTGAFTGTPATRPVYTSTGAKVEEIHPKIYTSLLTQSGTSNPTAIVLGTNTVGSISWARTGAGVYTGTLSGAFTADKTWLNVHNSDQSGGAIIIAKLVRTDANTVTLSTFNSSLVASDAFTQISLEVKVYP